VTAKHVVVLQACFPVRNPCDISRTGYSKKELANKYESIAKEGSDNTGSEIEIKYKQIYKYII
jgi:hypothetical protein